MSKMNFYRKLNAAIWFVLAVTLMVVVGIAWSKNGPYTMLSFFASLTIHGGFCFFIGYLIDEKICNHFNK